MADTYRGLTIRIGGDATSLQKALRSVNSSISATEQQLRKMLVIHFVHSNFQIRAFSPMIGIFYHSAARGARQKPHQSPYIAPPDFRQTPPSTAKRHGFFCHAA